MVWEKPIPLHPLLRTNAVTRQLLSQKERQKKEFFEKITINREVVVQEAGFFSTLYYIGVMDKGVLGRTKPINFWRWYRMIFGGILNRDKTNFPSGKVIIKILYNGEFDPGSGWTLATGLTHASRGVTSGRACSSRMTTGARVSNAYPTWPIPRDSPSKGGLIPYAVIKMHILMTKGLAVWDGDASD